MNSIWKTYRLEQCVELMPCGYGFDLGEEETDAPVIKVSNIAGDGKIYGNFERRSFPAKVLGALLANEDDLLVVKSSGSKANILSGKTAIVRDEHVRSKVATNFLLRLQPKRDVVDPRLLWYILNSSRTKAFIKTIVGTTTYPNLKWEQYRLFEFRLPPLLIQNQIAAIMEKADGAREKRRHANQLTEQFLQSAFLEMFGDPVTNPNGWDTIEAGKIFEIKLGKMLDEKRFTGKNLRPYLRNVNVQWGSFNLADVQEMDFAPDEFERNKLRRGDILVCEGGEVGRCAIWQEEIPNCGYQKALHRLRAVQPIIDSRYFVNFMKLAATHGLLLRDTSQVTIAHFTAEKFQEFKVLLPPLSKQQEFAALVENVQSLRTKQKDSEKELENLFGGLMQRAFRGKLVQ